MDALDYDNHVFYSSAAADPVCNVFLVTIFQADPGAGNPSRLLLLLRL